MYLMPLTGLISRRLLLRSTELVVETSSACKRVKSVIASSQIKNDEMHVNLTWVLNIEQLYRCESNKDHYVWKRYACSAPYDAPKIDPLQLNLQLVFWTNQFLTEWGIEWGESTNFSNFSNVRCSKDLFNRTTVHLKNFRNISSSAAGVVVLQ